MRLTKGFSKTASEFLVSLCYLDVPLLKVSCIKIGPVLGL